MKKHVVMQADPDVPMNERVVYVTGGFGAYSFTHGSAIMVETIRGETQKMSGYEIDRTANQEEIDQYQRDRESWAVHDEDLT